MGPVASLAARLIEPTATMEVARGMGRPVKVLFQPHRYSRTRRFAPEFADALATGWINNYVL